MNNVPWVNYIENKLHTQSLESSTQSSVFEAIESDLQRQLCHAQLECMNYIEKTMNTGANLLQKGIDCKIKNRFCRMKLGNENVSIEVTVMLLHKVKTAFLK